MGMGFATFKLMDIDGFSTFALTGRDGFVAHPCELVIVGNGYKPFLTFGCQNPSIPVNAKVANPYPLI
jgi:hypothetical protein